MPPRGPQSSLLCGPWPSLWEPRGFRYQALRSFCHREACSSRYPVAAVFAIGPRGFSHRTARGSRYRVARGPRYGMPVAFAIGAPVIFATSRPAVLAIVWPVAFVMGDPRLSLSGTPQLLPPQGSRFSLLCGPWLSLWETRGSRYRGPRGFSHRTARGSRYRVARGPRYGMPVAFAIGAPVIFAASRPAVLAIVRPVALVMGTQRPSLSRALWLLPPRGPRFSLSCGPWLSLWETRGSRYRGPRSFCHRKARGSRYCVARGFRHRERAAKAAKLRLKASPFRDIVGDAGRPRARAVSWRSGQATAMQ